MSGEETDGKGNVRISIPSWLMPVINSVLTAAVLATMAWALNAEQRIQKGEEALVKVEVIEEARKAEHTEFALLKQQIQFMRDDLKEVLTLVKQNNRE